MKIDTTQPRYAHFAGLSEAQIRLALWLADRCETAAAATIRQRGIDDRNREAVRKLCDEIDSSALSFSAWLQENKITINSNPKAATA